MVCRTANERQGGDLMELKKMRRTCAALVQDLDLPAPAEPGHLITSLCERMSQRLGRPVNHRLVRFPPDTVSGLWLATDTEHYVLCEQDTSPWHQLAITGHEFWHMEADHEAMAVQGADAGRLVLPSLDPQTVARIVAARTHCSDEAEQEAEFFASLLLAKVSRWLPQRTWTVPDSAAAVVDRMETSLGTRPQRGDRG
ncbi:hypothetical protein [Wenjunlia tyrosinilytica]|nr:hypothetical protein [Wenjunlia tyrosinilytica]